MRHQTTIQREPIVRQESPLTPPTPSQQKGPVSVAASPDNKRPRKSCSKNISKKAMKISFIFGLLLALFSVAVNGFRFYSPYDVFKSRQTRWSNRDSNANNGADEILYPPDSNADYYKIISYLNDVGKRRR